MTATLAPAQVFVAVGRHRGITLRELSRETGLTQAALRRIVERLESDGFVRLRNGVIHITITDGSAAARDQQVLQLVRDAGPDGTTTSVIAERLGVKRGHAYLSLFRLAREGLVKVHGAGRSAFWTAT